MQDAMKSSARPLISNAISTQLFSADRVHKYRLRQFHRVNDGSMLSPIQVEHQGHGMPDT